MEFEWEASDEQFRAELRDFLEANLPASWEQISHHGPGADETADFSRDVLLQQFHPLFRPVYGDRDRDQKVGSGTSARFDLHPDPPFVLDWIHERRAWKRNRIGILG